MKYIILLYGSQQAYDAMAGKKVNGVTLSPADFGPMFAFMGAWNKGIVESGEFVDGQGLAAPVHTRRVQLKNGAAVVTSGPYAETEEVIAGYTIVDCASFDRAVEIAGRLTKCPYPKGAPGEFKVDIRPIGDSRADLEL